MSRRKKRYKKSLGVQLLGRAVRSIVAVVILSALVLGVAYSVKEISTFDKAKFAKVAGPYLSKVGIDAGQVGEVAGKFISRIQETGISGMGEAAKTQREEVSGEVEGDVSSAETSRTSKKDKMELFSMAIISDTHIASDPKEYKENAVMLTNTLKKVREKGLNRVVLVGDITNLGVLGDLREVRGILDGSGLIFYAVPGDRDLWTTVGPANFLQVFEKNNHDFTVQKTKFLVLDNSANYTKIDDKDLTWFKNQLAGTDFLILSQPLYADGLSFPYNKRFMGSTQETPESESLAKLQQEVFQQRNEILQMVQVSNVKAVIAGNHHRYSELTDPQRPDLVHISLGALSSYVSLEGEVIDQGAVQKPEFVVLAVYEDGDYSIEHITM